MQGQMIKFVCVGGGDHFYMVKDKNRGSAYVADNYELVICA